MKFQNWEGGGEMAQLENVLPYITICSIKWLAKAELCKIQRTSANFFTEFSFPSWSSDAQMQNFKMFIMYTSLI